MINTIDKHDRSILSILQTDGRITNLQLAEKVFLSPTAVHERVKRLTRDGFIEGYSARLNASLLGFGMTVFVEVKLDRTTKYVFEAFARAANRAPEVMECHMVAGGFDYLLKTQVRDMAAYRAFLSDVLLALPGVRETHTYAVMEEVKVSAGLPI